MRRLPSIRRLPRRIPIEKAPCQSSRGFFPFAAERNASLLRWRCQCGLLVGQPDAGAAAELRAILVGLEPDGADAVGSELLVAVLGIAGHADRADDLAGSVADLQPTALREDLAAACAHGRAQG